ncbi:tripartite tricarboxylate transporter substrate binding protein [Belnapia rosea]|uniref:Tripartite-type tricarboxylate transporter, receptor component TctC n=1 Tax=Belnapia rosea TaxID=938405 RepID=A0A1G6KFF5_9PROT|nr:tripartite tricarboxylate transporter substrate binding protein [Belnapia rosea]SDB18507.1 Tripartite-type tricarboxylate transporter, receptor component TctC [Belnapia rosea]SDC29657.1 Tripartite-type tricarboxylate transporter, receptor component TctC [Belnapia rosea]
MYRRSLLALAAAPALARAQGFPDRPVTLVVPYAPGGSADVLARVLAPPMSEFLGHPVVVELRPGAGGNIGAAHVANGVRADGHAMLLGSISLATAPALQAISFDPLRDLVAVAALGAVPSLMVVSPDSPFRSLGDVLAAARARPGEVTFGSSGPGTGSHLAGVLLAAQADVEMTHVPYRGSGAVYPDLIAQRIGFLLDGMGSSAGQVTAGAVRAIGITAPERSAQFPDVPTLAESGLPGFEFLIWLGFFVRAGTPEPARQRLEAAVLHALSLPGVQEKLRQSSTMPLPPTGAEFGRWFAADVERWQGLVRQGKLARLE